MAEYIDREKLIAEYDRVHVGVAGGARQLMVDAPTEDVVPVVRCKDCKHYKAQEKSAHWENKTKYCCRTVNLKVNDNDFCSYGERKADNGNG